MKKVLILALLAAGCVTVSKSVLMDRSAHPVPQEDVYVYLANDEVPGKLRTPRYPSRIGQPGLHQRSAVLR